MVGNLGVKAANAPRHEGAGPRGHRMELARRAMPLCDFSLCGPGSLHKTAPNGSPWYITTHRTDATLSGYDETLTNSYNAAEHIPRTAKRSHKKATAHIKPQKTRAHKPHTRPPPESEFTRAHPGMRPRGASR